MKFIRLIIHTVSSSYKMPRNIPSCQRMRSVNQIVDDETDSNICLPLKYSLIAWGYCRLLLAGLILTGMSYALNRLIQMSKSEDGQYRDNKTFVLTILCSIILVVVIDIILGIVFIFGCHKRDASLVKKYYRHNLILLALLIPLSLYNLGWLVFIMIKYGMPVPELFLYTITDLIVSLTYVVIQIYAVLFAKSEYVKLENSYIFQFEHNVSEANCSLKLEKQNNLSTYKKKDENDEKEICLQI